MTLGLVFASVLLKVICVYCVAYCEICSIDIDIDILLLLYTLFRCPCIYCIGGCSCLPFLNLFYILFTKKEVASIAYYDMFYVE